MKHLFVIGTETEIVKKIIYSSPQPSGSYNWINVFKSAIGNYNNIKERLEEFDVVHVNLVPSSFSMAMDASDRLKNSSTKLVFNNDYLPEIWQKWNYDPMVYFNIQKLADCVFGTEPIQVSQMIEGAHCIPHPTNTKEIKLFKGNGEFLSVIYNPYDKNMYNTALMTQRLKDEFKLKTKLINYRKNEIHGLCKNYFDKIRGPLPFKEWLMELCTSKYAYLPHLFHSYNRTGVELACLGIPSVGSDRSYSLNICYPKTVCNPLDFKKTKELFKKLERDKFRQEVVDYAREKSEFFNYKNSKERYIKMLDEVKK